MSAWLLGLDRGRKINNHRVCLGGYRTVRSRVLVLGMCFHARFHGAGILHSYTSCLHVSTHIRPIEASKQKAETRADLDGSKRPRAPTLCRLGLAEFLYRWPFFLPFSGTGFNRHSSSLPALPAWPIYHHYHID